MAANTIKCEKIKTCVYTALGTMQSHHFESVTADVELSAFKLCLQTKASGRVHMP